MTREIILRAGAGYLSPKIPTTVIRAGPIPAHIISGVETETGVGGFRGVSSSPRKISKVIYSDCGVETEVLSIQQKKPVYCSSGIRSSNSVNYHPAKD